MLAAGFNKAERTELLKYKSITRAAEFTHGGRRYLSGLSYQIVDMNAAELYGLFKKADHTLPRALPGTYKAKFVGTHGALPLVQLVHGNAMINGGYTVIWQPDDSVREIRFWMSQERPHDVQDIWGYFRIQDFGSNKALVTVALALDLGNNSSLTTHEKRIHKMMLKSARYVRKFVDRRHGKAVK
jgi:hypothetical protein